MSEEQWLFEILGLRWRDGARNIPPPREAKLR
jgi:hypothetical protein